MKGFSSLVGDCMTRKFKEGLNSKVKLSLYKIFNDVVEFKEYRQGVSDAASRLKCLSLGQARMGLLGRHREREGMKECLLCDNECEGVSHVWW